MPDELTLPAEQPATESSPAEPLPQPLDVSPAFQRVLAQHDADARAHLQSMLEQRDRESELKLQRALADLERARRQSSLTPHRDALSPVTWGDLERFRDDLYFRLVMMGEIGGFLLLSILIILALRASPPR
jgi:hypothetical protein